MRRALTFLLLLLFSYPLIAPAFAFSPDEASLPACCRRNGKHHCDMAGMMMPQDTQRATIAEKCPYSPQAQAPVSWPDRFAPALSQAIFSGIVHHPAVAPQTEAHFRISFDRSRQKRGPPASLAL